MELSFLINLLSLFYPKDWFRNTTEMCLAYGFKVETHLVTTEDGHILTIFRIPGKQNENATNSKIPLILQPGIASASDIMISGGVPYSPGFFFASKGYDVWITNPRGNRYSRSHVKYNLTDPEYWNFTFTEMGMYDQKAYFDYILNATGHKKVHFLGHSQGSTQMFVALTLDPEYYAKRLYSFIGFGPVVKMDQLHSLILDLINQSDVLDNLEKLGIHEFAPFNQMASMGLTLLAFYVKPLYDFLIGMICDTHPSGMDYERILVTMAKYPSGSSTKCMKHIMQIHETKGLYRYREHPNDPLIPFELNNIPESVPIGIFAGLGDRLAIPESIAWITQELTRLNKNVITRIYPTIGHLGLVIPSKGNTKHFWDLYEFMQSSEK